MHGGCSDLGSQWSKGALRDQEMFQMLWCFNFAKMHWIAHLESSLLAVALLQLLKENVYWETQIHMHACTHTHAHPERKGRHTSYQYQNRHISENTPSFPVHCLYLLHLFFAPLLFLCIKSPLLSYFLSHISLVIPFPSSSQGSYSWLPDFLAHSQHPQQTIVLTIYTIKCLMSLFT